MTLINDIYVLKHQTQYLGQFMLNQYFYQQLTDDGDGDAFGLWEAFNDDILSVWRDTISDEVTTLNVEVFQIADGSDFFSLMPADRDGTRDITAAALMPSSVAFSYRSNRAGAGTRRSRKRYSGMGEADLQGNVLSTAFEDLTAVIDLGVALGGTVQAPADSIYKPIQVASGWAVNNPPTKRFDITAFEAAVLSTQNSRKP